MPAQALAAILLSATADAAAGQTPETPTPVGDSVPGLFERDTLLGLGGNLRDAGIALSALEVSEGFCIQQRSGCGLIYEGRFEADLDADLEKLLGLPDTAVHANLYQVHGRGPAANYLGGNLETISSIEAGRTTRMFDAWVQKGFFDASLSIRAGQIAGDDEFITSQYAGTLINATFGWPAIMSGNLPAGGPAYPLATPGIRVKEAISNALSIQAAAFGGPHFSIHDNLFAIVETQYAPPQEGTDTTPPTAYKIGAWFHSGPFPDLAVAAPIRQASGDFGIYAAADLLLYRPADSEAGGLGGFLRISGTPSDRNLVSFYADAGFNYHGILDFRPDDLTAVGIAYTQIGAHARTYDRQSGSATRDHEVALEATYQAAIAQWWSAQPDLQYVVHPTARVAQPAPGSVKRMGNAFVAGLRTSIRF